MGWWISGILAALLIGVLTGQYLPNRNVVTSDQLEQKFQLVAGELQSQNTTLEAQRQSIENLTNEIFDMKGQLKAKKLLQAQ